MLISFKSKLGLLFGCIAFAMCTFFHFSMIVRACFFIVFLIAGIIKFSAPQKHIGYFEIVIIFLSARIYVILM